MITNLTQPCSSFPPKPVPCHSLLTHWSPATLASLLSLAHARSTPALGVFQTAWRADPQMSVCSLLSPFIKDFFFFFGDIGV
jgi:hypothetical protein